MPNAYDYIKESLRNNLKSKMIGWRKEESVTRIDKPSDIGRARVLGYKDKKGYIVVRVKLNRGGRKRHRVNRNRRSKRQHSSKILKMNYRWVAEGRAQRKYPTLEVLNSYQVAKDGIHYFFEVILVDPNQPIIKADKTVNWICSVKNKNRALRGLTSAGKKSRGLR
ncbi:MAG: 50S ribosomal protein L15e [Candidatus Pacearchaeota archaeon]|nr:50S ribosomal protein L15e [Candidatus Pacearchaeota archaeon]